MRRLLLRNPMIKTPRFPWGNFPDVIRNGDLGELKREPEYAAAKAGDVDAAFDLVVRIVRPEFVDAVSRLGALHHRPILLPVLAEESAGNNRIPLGFAELLSDRLGWPVEREVLQIARAHRTDAGADHRLVSHPVFDGPVAQDAGYILIDDTLTMGGTIADLRGFAMNRGGQVLGSAVGVAHEGALHLPIKPGMIESIYTKHGKDVAEAFAQEQWGYGIDCLTQGEAGHIRKAVSLDALRDRFLAARHARSKRSDAREISSPPNEERQYQESIEVHLDALPGHPSSFIESPAGGLDFGELPEEAARIIRRQAGPIRLLESDLRHIEERHGDQIRQAGYPTIEDFVRSIAKDYNRIYPARSGSMAILVHRIGLERFAIIRLQPSQECEGPDYYAVKTASLCRPGYLLNRNPLLEQDGPIQSLARDPFDPGTEADVKSLSNGELSVKVLQTHPPPVASSHVPRNPFDTTQEKPVMAAQIDHKFSYGPLDVVATNDEKSPGLHVIHADVGNSAFLPEGDPLHKEVLALIEKNPHSKGFVANQIQARLEQEGRWHGPQIDEEGISFGPSVTQEVQTEVGKQSFQLEEIPAKKVDLPDELANQLNPRVQIRPLVLRDGAHLAPLALEPGDVLKGYVVGGAMDHLPDSKDLDKSMYSMDRHSFPAKQQRFGLEELEQARAAAQKMAAETVITMDGMEAAYQQNTGLPFSIRFPGESGKRWDALKVAHQEQVVDVAEQRDGPSEPEQKPSTPDLTANWPGSSLKPEVQAEEQKAPKQESEAPARVFPKKVPPEILLADQKKGKPLVLDHGDKVSVTNRAMIGFGKEAEERRNNAVLVGLKAAKERFGEPIRFSGNPAFEVKTIELAVKHGIQLEPATEHGKRAYEKALEAKNALGPSVNRAPTKTVQKEKGVEL